MDISAPAGLGLALISLLISTLIEHGDPLAYFNISGLFIVIGGTMGTALVSQPIPMVLSLPKLMRVAIKKTPEPDHEMVKKVSGLADKARREGLLALEQDAQALENPFLKKGVMLVVDGTDPDLVRSILETEIIHMEKRHEAKIGMLEAMGGFAPTMGILGTVMGLVHVLSNLSNANALGPAIATAFIATLYGVGTANLMWLPLALKLKRKNEEEVALHDMIMEGVLSLQAGDNPRIIEDKLGGFLSQAERNKGHAPEGAAEASVAASKAS